MSWPVEDADELARRIDNIYEEASNNPCTCRYDESGCPYCNAWSAARQQVEALCREALS